VVHFFTPTLKAASKVWKYITSTPEKNFQGQAVSRKGVLDSILRHTGHSPPRLPQPEDNSECTLLLHNTVTPDRNHPDEKLWLRHSETVPSPCQCLLHTRYVTTYTPKYFTENVLPIQHTAQKQHLDVSTPLNCRRCSMNENDSHVMTK
jgi:hypothetical protein